MLDLAFSKVLPGRELSELKRINLMMDYHKGQQDPSNANQHAMCGSGQGTGACLQGISDFLLANVLAAQQTTGDLSLDYLGEALHTISDWTSPAHVSDAGIPYTWYHSGTGENIPHFMSESSSDVNPGRFYLGVRLEVEIYKTVHPDRAGDFKNLDSWILQDARQRAAREGAPSGGDPRTLGGGRSNVVGEEMKAQCWAGNPAACN